jgi:kynurenine formamidase
MRRAIVVAGILSLAGGLIIAQSKQPSRAEPQLTGIPSGRTKIVDLTYPLSEKNVKWPGDALTFEAKTNATVAKDGYFTRSIWMLEHFGTHMDAPAHFPPGKATVDKIPVPKLFGPAVVIDVTKEAAKDPDYTLPAGRVIQWERDHDGIPAGSIVLLRTGWSKRWRNAEKYRGTDKQNVSHWPGFSVEAVKLLIQRKVSGLGIDTLSVDPGPSKDFAVHKLSHGAGLYHLENLADMSALPESGAFLVVAPIKLEGGSGGPCRVFAILP